VFPGPEQIQSGAGDRDHDDCVLCLVDPLAGAAAPVHALLSSSADRCARARARGPHADRWNPGAGAVACAHGAVDEASWRILRRSADHRRVRSGRRATLADRSRRGSGDLAPLRPELSALRRRLPGGQPDQSLYLPAAPTFGRISRRSLEFATYYRVLFAE